MVIFHNEKIKNLVYVNVFFDNDPSIGATMKFSIVSHSLSTLGYLSPSLATPLKPELMPHYHELNVPGMPVNEQWLWEGVLCAAIKVSP